MPFGQVSKSQINKLCEGIAVTSAKDMVRILGGSQQTQQFVDSLSLGVLSDKDFMKKLINLVGRTSRETRNIDASDIYGNAELAGKINAIYQEKGTDVVSKNVKLDELIEKEYPTKTGIERTVENNIETITAKVNEATSGEYTQEAVEGMLLENCAVQALNGITVVVPMIGMVEGLTKMAIEMVNGESEYEGTDSLKAAGKENIVSIGILKDMTGYEYATMTDESNITSPVIAYFDKNHVAQVNSKEDIAKIEKQGYKFTGLVLAQEGMEGLEYLSKGAEEVISEMTKGQEIGAKEKEMTIRPLQQKEFLEMDQSKTSLQISLNYQNFQFPPQIFYYL